MNKNTMKCPFCAEEILKNSKNCEFCKEQFMKSERNNVSKSNEVTEYHCTICKEAVHKDAQKCKHCGARLTPITFGENVAETISDGFNIISTVSMVCLVLLAMMWGCVALM